MNTMLFVDVFCFFFFSDACCKPIFLWDKNKTEAEPFESDKKQKIKV